MYLRLTNVIFWVTALGMVTHLLLFVGVISICRRPPKTVLMVARTLFVLFAVRLTQSEKSSLKSRMIVSCSKRRYSLGT
jgi:hypothetical protein